MPHELLPQKSCVPKPSFSEPSFADLGVLRWISTKSKPSFLQMLLRVSPSSVEARRWFSICTSNLPGVGESFSSRCKVDVLACERFVSRTAACHQSQIARLLLFTKLAVRHTSEGDVPTRFAPLSRQAYGWVKNFWTSNHSPSLPDWDLCCWDSNPLFALRLACPTNPWGANKTPPNLSPLSRRERSHKNQSHQETSAPAPSRVEMDEPKRVTE